MEINRRMRRFSENSIDSSHNMEDKWFAVFDWNIEECLRDLSENGSYLQCLSFHGLKFDSAKSFISSYKGDVTKFTMAMQFNWKSSDLIKVLNLMPNLEVLNFLSYNDSISIEIEEDPSTSKRLKLSAELKLPKLKILHVNSKDPSIYEFCAKFFPENQIVEFHSEISDFGPYNEECYGAVCKLFSAQKSIRKVEAVGDEIINALHLLSIDELRIANSSYSDLKLNHKILRQLKTLNIAYVSKKLCDEICKLENLEKLEIDTTLEDDENDLKLMQNLKNLKTLRYGKFNEIYSSVNLHFDFQHLTRFDHLEELELLVKIHTAEILELLPHVKILKFNTSLKLNHFVKFRCLETLMIHFEASKGFELCEVDTAGILNENLKELTLKVRGDEYEFWKTAQNLSNVVEIFPNLEVLKFKMNEGKSWDKEYHGIDNIEKEFFASLREWKKLKELKLMFIPLRHFKGNRAEIADELKKLAEKLNKVQLYFMDYCQDLLFDEETNFYQDLIENVGEVYEIVNDGDEDFIQGRSTLYIRSEK